MKFSPKAKREFDWLLTRYPKREAAMLPTLRLIEREFGKITVEGMRYCAELLEVAPAKVWGVVTFYTHFKRETDGEKVIYVCNTLPCALRGSDALCDHICERLGIAPGQTTPDGKVTVKKVECLALCDDAPVIQVDDEDVLRVDVKRADALLERLGAKTVEKTEARA